MGSGASVPGIAMLRRGSGHAPSRLAAFPAGDTGAMVHRTTPRGMAALAAAVVALSASACSAGEEPDAAPEAADRTEVERVQPH